MDTALFDFDLPEDRIALRPAVPRDSARMMVVHADGAIEHRRVRDLPEFLMAGDTLVVNDTRVLPARLYGERLRGPHIAKVEFLLHRRLAPDRYAALARPAKKMSIGDRLHFGTLSGTVVARDEGSGAEIVFSESGTALDAAILALGQMPLPPYIARQRQTDAQDTTDYQTIFARQAGSVAAPTAGLHFTPELLAALSLKGTGWEQITLHVGPGTFLPVAVEDISRHRMHPEWASLETDAATRLNAVQDAGKRIVAVGTTSLRTLETAVNPEGSLRTFIGDTSIFITPGHVFRSADVLLTNFHLPRSTLFMLVSAFMGLDVMKAAYAEAIREGYRFYSYGDACLLFRRP